MSGLRARLALLVWMAAGLPGWAAASGLEPGDLVVSDTRRKQLVRVDPESGSRELITSNESHPGPKLAYPADLAVGPGGRPLLVIDTNLGALFAVDPDTGERRLVTSREQQVAFQGRPRSVILGTDGAALIGLSGPPGRILWVDLATGGLRPVVVPELGQGPALVNPIGLALAADGALLVADSRRGLLRVALPGAQRKLLRGLGAELSEPYDLALGSAGEIYSVDKARALVLRLDPGSGRSQVVTGAGVGRGPELVEPHGIALDGAGRAYVADRRGRVVWRVDLATGLRAVHSSADVGSGPGFGSPRRVAVVPPAAPREATSAGGDLPRPAGLLLACGVAALALLGLWRWRRAAGGAA